jgi:predicted TPR repeat methyltransferase
MLMPTTLALLVEPVSPESGITAFCDVLGVAERWLAERWELVFPRVEDDALSRQNALSCLADPIEDSLARAGLQSLQISQAVLRYERKDPVIGHLVVARCR